MISLSGQRPFTSVYLFWQTALLWPRGVAEGGGHAVPAVGCDDSTRRFTIPRSLDHVVPRPRLLDNNPDEQGQNAPAFSCRPWVHRPGRRVAGSSHGLQVGSPRHRIIRRLDAVVLDALFVVATEGSGAKPLYRGPSGGTGVAGRADRQSISTMKKLTKLPEFTGSVAAPSELPRNAVPGSRSRIIPDPRRPGLTTSCRKNYSGRRSDWPFPYRQSEPRPASWTASDRASGDRDATVPRRARGR